MYDVSHRVVSWTPCGLLAPLLRIEGILDLVLFGWSYIFLPETVPPVWIHEMTQSLICYLTFSLCGTMSGGGCSTRNVTYGLEFLNYFLHLLYAPFLHIGGGKFSRSVVLVGLNVCS